jgi:hypothetical protein
VADFTRPATWDDLKLVAEALNAEGARYALIGGYAIAAHGYSRFSEDLDILVDRQACWASRSRSFSSNLR